MKRKTILGATVILFLCFSFSLKAECDLLLADFETDSELLDFTALAGMLLERSVDFASRGNFSLKMTYSVYSGKNPVVVYEKLKGKNLMEYHAITCDLYNPQETDIAASFVANVSLAGGGKQPVWAKNFLLAAKQTNSIVVPVADIFDVFSRLMKKEGKDDLIGNELKIENFFFFVSSRFHKEKELVLYLDNLWLKGSGGKNHEQ